MMSAPVALVGKGRHLKIILLVGAILSGGGPLLQPLCAEDDGVIALEGRREIFVDRHMIDTLINARLRLHHPHREGIALGFDRPWEGIFSGVIAVMKDGELCRMYYRGLPEVSTPELSSAVVCYAESKDGIAWTKPNLGIYQVNGTRDNNVVLANDPPFTGNFTPFIDRKPAVPPNERFKALAGDAKSGLVAFVSGDGIHWKRLRPNPVLTDGMFDSQNIAFWSESEEHYVCYFRTWTGEGYSGFRTVSRSTSRDFLNWTRPVEMEYGDTPREHIYTNGTHPYYRAPQIYLSFGKRFFPEKAALPPEEAEALVENPSYRVASSDAVLMSSRGGNKYDRTFMEAFIRPGADVRDWVSRDNTPAPYVVPANDRELYIYRLSHYAQPSSHLTRYSLRVDGFVSVLFPYEGGELITRAFTFTGRELELNFSSSAAGGVRVEIQDAKGAPLPGYELDKALEMIGDDIERAALWKKGTDLSELAGEAVRLRFVIRDADLYSFRFRSQGEERQ